MDIRERLIFFGVEADVLEAADRSLETGSIFSTDICPVVDTEGNPLVVDGIYRNSFGTKIKVRSWSFGCGNIIEKYYRVFYTDENLDDSHIVVKAKYSDILGSATYKSSLSLVEDETIV